MKRNNVHRYVFCHRERKILILFIIVNQNFKIIERIVKFTLINKTLNMYENKNFSMLEQSNFCAFVLVECFRRLCVHFMRGFMSNVNSIFWTIFKLLVNYSIIWTENMKQFGRKEHSAEKNDIFFLCSLARMRSRFL
jgi:Na+/melibiose symporter-like transporter